MATPTLRRVIVYQIDDAALDKHFATLGRQLASSNREVESHNARVSTMGRLWTQVKAALATFAVGVALRGLFQLNSGLEQSRIAFTTLLGSAREADTFLRDLIAFAARTPFEVQGLITSSRQLLGMGFEAARVLPIMEAIGNAISALGGGEFEIQRVVRALGQMQAKGKVSAEEMNQLAELGLPVWQMLADAIGTSVPEAMERARKGGITAAEGVNGILQGMMTRYRGAMEAQAETGKGIISTLVDLFKEGMRELSGPAYEEFVNDLRAIRDALERAQESGSLSRTLKAVGEALASAYRAGRTFLGWVVEYRAEIGTLLVVLASYRVAVTAITVAEKGYALAVAASNTIVATYRATVFLLNAAMALLKGNLIAAGIAMTGFNKALRANPVGFVVAGLTALAAVLWTVLERSNDVRDGFKKQREEVEELNRSIRDLSGSAAAAQVEAARAMASEAQAALDGLKRERDQILDAIQARAKAGERVTSTVGERVRLSALSGQIREAERLNEESKRYAANLEKRAKSQLDGQKRLLEIDLERLQAASTLDAFQQATVDAKNREIAALRTTTELTEEEATKRIAALNAEVKAIRDQANARLDTAAIAERQQQLNELNAEIARRSGQTLDENTTKTVTLTAAEEKRIRAQKARLDNYTRELREFRTLIGLEGEAKAAQEEANRLRRQSADWAERVAEYTKMGGDENARLAEEARAVAVHYERQANELQRQVPLLKRAAELEQARKDHMKNMGPAARTLYDALENAEQVIARIGRAQFNALADQFGGLQDMLDGFNEHLAFIRKQKGLGLVSPEQAEKDAAAAALAFRDALVERLKALSAEMPPEIKAVFDAFTDQMVSAITGNLGEGTQATKGLKEGLKDAGDQLQNLARSGRSLLQLVSAVGEVSDAVRTMADGFLSAVDNAGALFNLASDAGGFSKLFSSPGGVLSSVSPLIGIGAGIATAVAGMIDLGGPSAEERKQRGQEAFRQYEAMRALRHEVLSNVRALRENTDALKEAGALDDTAVNDVRSMGPVVDAIIAAITKTRVVGNVSGQYSEVWTPDVSAAMDQLNALFESNLPGLSAFKDFFESQYRAIQQSDQTAAMKQVLTAELIRGMFSGSFAGTSLEGLFPSVAKAFEELGMTIPALFEQIIKGLTGEGGGPASLSALMQGAEVAQEFMGSSAGGALRDMLASFLRNASTFLGGEELSAGASGAIEKIIAGISDNTLTEEGLAALIEELYGARPDSMSANDWNDFLRFVRELAGDAMQEGGGAGEPGKTTTPGFQYNVTAFQGDAMLRLLEIIAYWNEQTARNTTARVLPAPPDPSDYRPQAGGAARTGAGGFGGSVTVVVNQGGRPVEEVLDEMVTKTRRVMRT